jgi:hypothetical protein
MSFKEAKAILVERDVYLLVLVKQVLKETEEEFHA